MISKIYVYGHKYIFLIQYIVDNTVQQNRVGDMLHLQVHMYFWLLNLNSRSHREFDLTSKLGYDLYAFCCMHFGFVSEVSIDFDLTSNYLWVMRLCVSLCPES